MGLSKSSRFYKQTETTYELNPIIIRDHWLAEIRDRIENSQKSTDLLIQKMVSANIILEAPIGNHYTAFANEHPRIFR